MMVRKCKEIIKLVSPSPQSHEKKKKLFFFFLTCVKILSLLVILDFFDFLLFLLILYLNICLLLRSIQCVTERERCRESEKLNKKVRKTNVCMIHIWLCVK